MKGDACYSQMCDLQVPTISLALRPTFITLCCHFLLLHHLLLSFCLIFFLSLTLSLCSEPTHIQMRGEPLFFFQHTDRQHWLLGPIVHRALHIYHNLTNKMRAWMHVLVCVVCTGVSVKGLQTYFSRLTNHQMFSCFNLKQLLKDSLSSVIILSPFLVIL